MFFLLSHAKKHCIFQVSAEQSVCRAGASGNWPELYTFSVVPLLGSCSKQGEGSRSIHQGARRFFTAAVGSDWLCQRLWRVGPRLTWRWSGGWTTSVRTSRLGGGPELEAEERIRVTER